MKGRPVADGVAWPIPSISGAHAHYAHYAYNSTAHAYTCIACVHIYRFHDVKGSKTVGGFIWTPYHHYTVRKEVLLCTLIIYHSAGGV